MHSSEVESEDSIESYQMEEGIEVRMEDLVANEVIVIEGEI